MWSGSRVPFLNFARNHVFGIGEARHFKFCELIDTQEYNCMRDILHPKRCVQSRDLLKFSEIYGSIPLAVQDKDIVAMGD